MSFVLISLIIVFIFAKVLQVKTSEVKVAAKLDVVKNDLIIDNRGSIHFEENDYFKKYIITLKEETKDIDWKETSDFIEIKLDKQYIDNLGISHTDKKILNEITAKKNNDEININIKKTYNKNFVFKDLRDGKKVIVLIGKVEKPYDYKVILDPGHGAYDVGTNRQELKEKDITLKIAKYAVNDLIYNGCDVVLTRDKDIVPRNAKNSKEDVRARAAIANEENGDLFISIHVNDFTDNVQKGITTYYFCPNNFQLEERKKLAKLVQEQLIKDDGWKDRGIKSENFGVLRTTNMPSILIECGYISNQEDRDRLTNDKMLRNIAYNLSEGVIDYLKTIPKNKK